MERKRILELAVEALQQQKAQVEADIQTIQAELKGTGFGVSESKEPQARRRSPAERKAQAERMREYWAAKRAQAKPRAAAAKKALSLKMKEIWKKRKAAAAAKKAKSKS
jgi:uncharacterized protein (UPF0335 family)